MYDQRAFSPSGKTILIASDSTAPDGVQASSTIGAPQGSCQYRIANPGAVTVHVAESTTSAAAAKAKAVVPTGTAQHSYCIPAASVLIITAPANTFWSSISASAVSVFVTPGAGL